MREIDRLEVIKAAAKKYYGEDFVSGALALAKLANVPPVIRDAEYRVRVYAVYPDYTTEMERRLLELERLLLDMDVKKAFRALWNAEWWPSEDEAGRCYFDRHRKSAVRIVFYEDWHKWWDREILACVETYGTSPLKRREESNLAEYLAHHYPTHDNEVNTDVFVWR